MSGSTLRFIIRHLLFFIAVKIKSMRMHAEEKRAKGDKVSVGCWQYVTTAEDIRSQKSVSLILPRQRQKYETILSSYITRVFFDERPSNQPFYSRRVS